MKQDRADTVITPDEQTTPTQPIGAKERFYEKIRMPLWVLDTILVVLIAAIVVFLIIGFVKGNA